MAYGSIESRQAASQGDSSSRVLRREGFSWVFGVLATTTATAVACLLVRYVVTNGKNRESRVIADAPILGVAKNLARKSTLSERGQSVKAVRDDLLLFEAGLLDPYDPIQNPEGYLVMLVAENKLMWKETARKLEEVQKSDPLPEWIFTYGDMTGQEDFCKAMARIFSKWIEGPVDPRYVKAQAGAGSVLAQLSYLLGDPDDGVLVAAPNYPAFQGDFHVYGGMQLHTVQAAGSAHYAPSISDLDRVYAEAIAAGHPPRVFIICQPNNPTGTMYSHETMKLLITWALEKDLHVVSDEIYALSVFPGRHTTSAATVMYELNPDDELYLGDQVHIAAGLSKDWGMSGFRVGTLFSHNEKLLNALGLIAYYPAVSQYTQFALTQMFADDAWVDWYIEENQKRLFATYQALVAALDRVQVPVVPAEGAIFAWADFSSLLLKGQTEKELWLELFNEAKVILTLGDSCNEETPAMFRVVYPWPEGGPIAMKELGDRLVRWKSRRESNQR